MKFLEDHRIREGHSNSSFYSRKSSPVDLVHEGLFLFLCTDTEKEMQHFLDYKEK